MKFFLSALVAVCFSSVAQAFIDWPVLDFIPVVTADHPVYVTSARDGSGRFFVIEQPGRIQIVSGAGFRATPFLDISDRVLYDGERGLLSAAFPPDYATKKHFYVNYTRESDGATVVSRFSLTADANVADATSEEIVLTVPQPFGNHNGGQLQFGPDGFLYIGMGDGGNAGDPGNRAQNPQQLLGKMLRLDVESGVSPYAVPASNPFVSRPRFLPEIWALGLRNPWRFSFDRLTGDLYLADVGQGLYEEVDFQPASSTGGQNYGWRLREATHRFLTPQGYPAYVLARLTRPVTEYSHAIGKSVTGGYVYRGSAQARMNGIYFFADFVSGRIFGLAREGRLWKRQELAATDFNLSSFGENESGELFMADHTTGKIFHVVDAGVAWPPTATPRAGAYHRRTVVLRSLTADALIHYTLNGIDPVESDPSVASGGRVLINATATLKARAFRDGLQPSGVLTQAYTIR